MKRREREAAETSVVPVAPEPHFAARIRELAARQPMRGALLPLLHAIQADYGWIDDAMIPYVAQVLNISRADVHGVVTFYHDFRRRPAGAHVVKICRAEACQARGGRAVEAMAADLLGVAMGATRDDGRVTLEPVFCLGLCATGPNALVDGRPVSRLDADGLGRIAATVLA